MGAEMYACFKSIFQECYSDMVRIALFYTCDLAAAEDITQEIFAGLWEKRDRLETVDNLKGYLSLAVKNRCLNHIKHRQVIDRYRQEYLETDSEDDQVGELLDKVRVALEKLPEKRREILELSIVGSKTYREIADIQGISLNTVKDHIRKSYIFLRREISKDLRDILLFFAFYSK